MVVIRSLLLGAALLAVSAFSKNDTTVQEGAADPKNWPEYGRIGGSQGYSPLDQINTRNIDKVGLVWTEDLESGNALTEPVVADGVMYAAIRHSYIIAIDAATGRRLWSYDPKAFENAGGKMRNEYGSRGLAYKDGRVFTGTVDGRLIALEAKTGKLLWDVNTSEPGDKRYITGAPRPFKDKVVIGHGGGDFDGTRGYVTCYDAATGKQLWRFYTVPDGSTDDPVQAMAAKTWYGENWKQGAGGAVWAGISYDADFNRIYMGTGNAQPWNRDIRSEGRGDNLFSASIVAVDADSGKYVWHYQLNPGEEWDFDAANDIHLGTLTIDGKSRKVAMQSAKNGFFYVIDRATGKLISAEPLAKVTWATKIDIESGRPVEVDGVHYHGRKPFEMWPTSRGAHNWIPGAFSPKSGLAYLPITERGRILSDSPNAARRELDSTGEGTFLRAWNPTTQKLVWQVETANMTTGAVMATAGDLVFQGSVDNTFNAYDAKTGKLVWTYPAGVPLMAPPISYEVRGVQYISITTGIRSAGLPAGSETKLVYDYRGAPKRVLTFALNGKLTLPAPPTAGPPPADPEFKPDPERVAAGEQRFAYCAICHGQGAIGTGGAPDLRFSPMVFSKDAFQAVVRDGALIDAGMARFGELTPEQVEEIRFYIRSRADVARRSQTQ